MLLADILNRKNALNAGLGVTKTTAELETLFSTMPDPAIVANSLGITESQALTLMEDHFGIVQDGTQGPPPIM